MGFGVWGLGFGVWGLGFGVWGLGFRVVEYTWALKGFQDKGLGSKYIPYRYIVGFAGFCVLQKRVQKQGSARTEHTWELCREAPLLPERPNGRVLRDVRQSSTTPHPPAPHETSGPTDDATRPCLQPAAQFLLPKSPSTLNHTP